MYIKELFDTGSLSARNLAASANRTLVVPYGVSRSNHFTLEVNSSKKNIIIVNSPNAMQRISTMYSFMHVIGNVQATKNVFAVILDCDSAGEGLIFQGMEGVEISASRANYQNLASVNLASAVKVITERRNTCYDHDYHDYQSYNQYAVANGLDEIVPMFLFIDNLDIIFTNPNLEADKEEAVKNLKLILKYAASMGVVIIASTTAGFTADMGFLEQEMSLQVIPEASGNLVRIANADLRWESEIVRLPNTK